MNKHWAYCSACDRQVEVAVQADRDGDRLVCLEVGHTCTGALCPITDVSPDAMREALRRMVADEPTDEERE